MAKARHPHSEQTPTTLSEKSQSDQAPTSPLAADEIQHLLDAIHDTSGLLAVQHQLVDGLDGPGELQPLLRHGMFVLTNVIAEHFGEVEVRVRDLVQEITRAVREGGDTPAPAVEA